MSDDTETATDANGAEGAVPAKKKLAGKTLILFVVLPAVLLLGGGGAAAFFLMKPKADAHAPADGKDAAKDAHGKEEGKDAAKDSGKDAHGKDAKKDDKKKDEKGGHAAGAAAGDDKESGIKTSEGPNGEVFMTLPDMVVNINTADSRPVFLKLRLTLQAKDTEVADAIKPALPVVKDQYTAFLRELRMEDIQGSAGYSRLQLELLKRTNLAVAPAQVDAVLIEEILVN